MMPIVLLIVIWLVMSPILVLWKLEQIMSNEQDLENDVQAVADAVDALAKEIAGLKAAGAGAVTQAQLDALDAKAKAIAAAAAGAKPVAPNSVLDQIMAN